MKIVTLAEADENWLASRLQRIENLLDAIEGVLPLSGDNIRRTALNRLSSELFNVTSTCGEEPTSERYLKIKQRINAMRKPGE
jgi:hypothetical protein